MIRPLRVVVTSLFVDTGCDWSVEWLHCADSGVTADWFVETGDLHTLLSLCRRRRRRRRVLASTVPVSSR